METWPQEMESACHYMLIIEPQPGSHSQGMTSVNDNIMKSRPHMPTLFHILLLSEGKCPAYCSSHPMQSPIMK